MIWGTMSDLDLRLPSYSTMYKENPGASHLDRNLLPVVPRCHMSVFFLFLPCVRGIKDVTHPTWFQIIESGAFGTDEYEFVTRPQRDATSPAPSHTGPFFFTELFLTPPGGFSPSSWSERKNERTRRGDKRQMELSV